MGRHKKEGDPAITLAEECSELIQVLTKAIRFGSNTKKGWNTPPPGETKTRMEMFDEEWQDIMEQYVRFKAAMSEKKDS